MATLWRILKIVLFVIGLLVVTAYLLPRHTEVTRVLQMQAPPAVVFDRINTFQDFNDFSPWYELDPKALYAWSGPQRGVGARMTWDSKNSNVGKGSQEIVASQPYRRVFTRLDFGTGGRNDATWLIEPLAGGSRVSWTLITDAGMNPVVRWFGLFMDRMVGPDFVKGLAKLKVIVESDAKRAAASQANIQLLDMAAMDIAFVATKAQNTPDKGKIGAEIARAYGLIGAYIAANKLQMSGPPLAITHSYDAKLWVFDAGIPISGTPESLAHAGKNSGVVQLGKSYAGEALRAVHVGPYTSLEATYSKIQDYLRDHHLESGDAPWEQYISNSGNTPQEKLVTYVFWPIKPP